MITPVSCMSCGFEISSVAPIFWHIQAERLKEKLKAGRTAPGRAVENFALSSDNAKLLDKLGLKHDCCRMHVVFSMRFPNHT